MCVIHVIICFVIHVFMHLVELSVALKGDRLNVALKKLEDKILNEWFFEHYTVPNEEPFGHDVSNPFDFPFVKYVDPKPFLMRKV